MTDEPRTASGTRIYIGGESSSYDSAPQSDPSIVEIGFVLTVGRLNGDSEVHEAIDATTMRVRRHKASTDSGILIVTVAHTHDDAGQLAMREASKFEGEFNFEVRLGPQRYLFIGEVISAVQDIGGADTIISEIYQIAVNSEIVVN